MSFLALDSVEGLLAEARGKAFRRLCRAMNRDFEGLATAARRARKQGLLDNAWCRRLTRLDEAYSLVRHLNQQRICTFVGDLDNFLGKQLPLLKEKKEEREVKLEQGEDEEGPLDRQSEGGGLHEGGECDLLDAGAGVGKQFLDGADQPRLQEQVADQGEGGNGGDGLADGQRCDVAGEHGDCRADAGHDHDLGQPVATKVVAENTAIRTVGKGRGSDFPNTALVEVAIAKGKGKRFHTKDPGVKCEY